MYYIYITYIYIYIYNSYIHTCVNVNIYKCYLLILVHKLVKIKISEGN